jgi:hypothetical protein
MTNNKFSDKQTWANMLKIHKRSLWALAVKNSKSKKEEPPCSPGIREYVEIHTLENRDTV